MQLQRRTSSFTVSSYETAARPLRRPDRAAARAVRARAQRLDRGLQRRRTVLRPGRPRRSRGTLRGLRRPRGDRDGAARRSARQLRDHARRGRGGRIRGRVQPRRPEAFPPLRAGNRGSLMARIEDYGLIGDLQTVALVGRDGSIDWACFPRFDSGACFAALLGTTDQGRWLIAPRGDAWSVDRRYREGTLILETDWETDAGRVRVIDFMPPRGKAPDIVRIVEGLAGEVEMAAELVIRFDYGSTLPWVRRLEEDMRGGIAGADALCCRSPIAHRGESKRSVGEISGRG